MITHQVLIDTGPLVSIFSRRDASHQICVEQLRQLPVPLITCLPVITEAVWLLKENPIAVQKLLHECCGGLLEIQPINNDAMRWIAEFMQQYGSLNVQFADACLAYLAEVNQIETVFTLDRRDFSVFRLSGNRSLQLLPKL